LNRVFLAFRCFFNILFGGQLSDSALTTLGLSRRGTAPAASSKSAAAGGGATTTATLKTSDGALQILSIMQRDSRLLDFLMEDLTTYSDDQIGAAVRELHDQCRDSVSRYITLQPVIDGVEGTFAQAPSKDPGLVKFVGNVPAKPPSGGTLRHKGWRAAKVDLPALPAKQDATILAPAEIEVE
jgi:Domain of unknown function (DUF2760)